MRFLSVCIVEAGVGGAQDGQPVPGELVSREPPLVLEHNRPLKPATGKSATRRRAAVGQDGQ